MEEKSTEDVQSSQTHLDLSIQIPLSSIPFVSGHSSKTSLKSTSSFKSGSTSYSPRGILRNLSLQKKVVAHPESERRSLLSPSPMETAKTPSTAGLTTSPYWKRCLSLPSRYAAKLSPVVPPQVPVGVPGEPPNVRVISYLTSYNVLEVNFTKTLCLVAERSYLSSSSKVLVHAWGKQSDCEIRFFRTPQSSCFVCNKLRYIYLTYHNQLHYVLKCLSYEC